jgi:hypothetical protein
MAVCQDCGLEMLEAATCTVEEFVFPVGRRLPRIRFGSEDRRWRMRRCGDCGVERGGYHHPGCDIEQCPDCLGQAISCWCSDDETDAFEEDGPPWVDVPDAVEIISQLILKNPEWDHMNIDPVGPCGHVGKGHARDMVRGDDLPLDEWFQLGRCMWEETAAILFTCPSRDREKVGEIDLDVARKMDAYAKANDMPPWDLVYVTEHGNFRASDLVGLPGHPEFGPCTFDPQKERPPRRASR